MFENLSLYRFVNVYFLLHVKNQAWSRDCILDWCDGIIVRGHDRLWTQKAQWLTSALDCHEFPSAPRGLSTCARCVSSSSMTSLTIPTLYSLQQLAVIPTIILYFIRVQRFANLSGVKWQIILLTAKIFMPSFLSQKLGGKIWRYNFNNTNECCNLSGLAFPPRW